MVDHKCIVVNGEAFDPPTDPRVSLLDFLRETVRLTGTKKGCNQGACGACTVLVDGERILSCLALAAQYDGREITTIEGIGTPDALHLLQQAFIDHDGFQCGYCTPGQICSAIGMAAELRRGLPSAASADVAADRFAFDRDEVRERLSGNLCRCGAHNGIVAAVIETCMGGGGMIEFGYSRADRAATAIRLSREEPTAKFLGGGTNLVDLMREGVEAPTGLIDVTRLPNRIEVREDGAVLIDAATRNTAVAEHRGIRERYPMLAMAILAGASGQIRNMATVGGNLLQRTRCFYFYDGAARCNKRMRSAGCDAIEGFNRIHAVLGASPACVATHPSDMCVALAPLDATVHLDGPEGERTIPLTAFHRLPGDTPDVDTEIRPHELITAVELPALPVVARSTYRKVRDRSSYAFALVSVAAALDVDEGGVVRDVRIALGGVAHKPWRASKAEAALLGTPALEENFRQAARVELADAVPLRDNAFKPDLAVRTIVSTLSELAGREAA